MKLYVVALARAAFLDTCSPRSASGRGAGVA